MKKLILVLCSFLIVQCTCKRITDVLGPDACPSASFAVFERLVVKNNANSSTTALNLETSYANISMSFNEGIAYKLIIKGNESKAEFIYYNTGKVIQLNWYGNSTNGKYFQKNETLTIEVSNICKTELLGSAQINLTTIIGYSGFGVKVINFEDSPAVGVSTYGDLGPAGCGGDSKVITPANGGYAASPQGGNYYQYKAPCTSASTGVAWYFGGQDFNSINYSSLGSDPTRVYLNFFARGQANSQAQIIIKEFAYGSTLTRKFLANVAPNNWVLYSVKLSDIGVINPSKISTVSFNLGASAFQDANAQVDLDLLIFTLDKPF